MDGNLRTAEVTDIYMEINLLVEIKDTHFCWNVRAVVGGFSFI